MGAKRNQARRSCKEAERQDKKDEPCEGVKERPKQREEKGGKKRWDTNTTWRNKKSGATNGLCFGLVFFGVGVWGGGGFFCFGVLGVLLNCPESKTDLHHE